MRTAAIVAIAVLVAILTIPSVPTAPSSVRPLAPPESAQLLAGPLPVPASAPSGPAYPTPSLPSNWPTTTEIPFNNSSVAGNFLPTNGAFPTAAIYAAALGEYFVVGTNTVSLVNASTREVVGGITLLYSVLNDGVYDPVNHRFYALDENCLVHEIDPTGMTLVASIAVPCTPQSIAVNSTSGAVYVGIDQGGCTSSGAIAVVNSTSRSAWEVNVSARVHHLALDPVNGTLLYSGESQTYSGFSCVTTAILGWFHPGIGTANSTLVTIGTPPLQWIAFNGNGSRVLGDDDNNHVAAFSLPRLKSLGTIPFTNSANDAAIEYNPVTRDFDASGLSAQLIEVIDPANLSIVRNLTFPPSSYFYDSGDQAILGVDSATGDIFAPDGPLGPVVVANPNATAILGLTFIGATLDGVAVDPQTRQVLTQDDTDGVVYLVNGSALAVDHRTTYLGPYAVGGPLLFDPNTGAFTSFYGSVASIYPSNGTTLNSSTYSGCPGDATFSASSQDIWVTEPCVSEVYVLNSTTLSLVKTLYSGSSNTPNGIAYDPVHHWMYVAMGRSISVINATTFVNHTSISMGWLVSGLTYSSLCGCVYAAFTNGGRIVGIATSTNSIVSNTTSDGAQWLTAADGIGYVVGGEQYGANITVVNATTGRFVGQSPSGLQSQRVAYDPSSKELVVSSLGGGLTFINASTPFPQPLTSYAVTFDESGLGTGRTWGVVVNGTNYSSSSRSLVVDLLNGTHAYQVWAPSGFAAAAPFGNVTVSGATQSVAVKFDFPGAVFPVTFSETGLPSGTPWTLELNGSNVTTGGGDVVADLPNGSYAYRVNCSVGFVPELRNGSITVAGKALSRDIIFNPVEFVLAFEELGLPNGTGWGVTVENFTTNSSVDTVVLSVPNGTYRFQVVGPGGFWAAPSSGSVTIDGTNQTVDIDFYPVSLFNVTFTEQGLPAGTDWSVDLNGSAQSSDGPAIIAAEPNGSYGFEVGPDPGYYPTPGSGSVSITGQAVNVTIHWTAFVYAVSFQESGLPSGQTWTVTLQGTATGAMAGTSILFSEPNGTYSYIVGAIDGFTASPTGGVVTVDGSSVPVAIRFMQNATKPPVSVPRYNVSFTETGLPSGTSWSVTFNGSTLSAAGNLTFRGFVNGTYSYSVGTVDGMGADPGLGTVTVLGHSVTESIDFSAPPTGTVGPSGGGGTLLGLPADEGYALIAGLVLVIIVAAVAVLLLRRRPGPPSEPGSEGTSEVPDAAGTETSNAGEEVP